MWVTATARWPCTTSPATTTTYVATVTLPSGSVPTALAVDTVEWLRVRRGRRRTAGSSTSTPRPATPRPRAAARPRRRPSPLATIPWHWPSPVAPATSTSPTAGTGGGSLGGEPEHPRGREDHRHEPNPPTAPASAQSISLSPDGNEVLSVLSGLSFPGDVMATVNRASANTITSTVSLQTGTDAMGQLVSDGGPGLRLGHRRDERGRCDSEPESRRLRAGRRARI